MRLKVGEDGGAALDVVADFYIDLGGGIEQDIDARSELDEAHALAALQAIADLGIEDDAPRQQAGNLLEDNLLAVAFDGDDILLVQFGGGLIHGVQILAALVTHVANHARDGRAVDVHIEYVEEDAHAGSASRFPPSRGKRR